MTRFLKDSFTHALCAAVWGVPCVAWSGVPLLGERGPVQVGLFFYPLPGPILCGTGLKEAELERTIQWQMFRGRAEVADSLIAIASNREAPPEQRGEARVLLAGTGQERAFRYLDTHLPVVELPPLVVHPAP